MSKTFGMFIYCMVGMVPSAVLMLQHDMPYWKVVIVQAVLYFAGVFAEGHRAKFD